MATSQREEAKLTPSAHHAGRVWRPVGGDGLGESRASSCPLLGEAQPKGGAVWERGCAFLLPTSPIYPNPHPPSWLVNDGGHWLPIWGLPRAS